MIRQLTEADGPAILEVMADAAAAYRGVIPADCWHEPYMSEAELRSEIADGVRFFGWEERAQLLAVMGLQHVRDVTLIRHAYTRTAHQRRGIGGQLLAHPSRDGSRPAAGGDLGGRRVGHPLLRAARLPSRPRAHGHRPPGD